MSTVTYADIEAAAARIEGKAVKTPLIENQIADQAKARGITPERVMEDVILAAQPSKAFVQYEHLAGMLLYLVSDMGASATGAALSVDGAWTAT